eukprot:CAMPEP_0172589096 /NCGR_PEP_ID=MMETSP1068-20121228/7911_1 /TAXON_ID=35684 /ORGANISM="Pseudopedinella elastica, Strain CCMP716" /LENGTH=113 /DNA_ID=CAMNT_0013384623 /DNA_START=1 /DNA_END=339 /DNA_ORIENTATION=-
MQGALPAVEARPVTSAYRVPEAGEGAPVGVAGSGRPRSLVGTDDAAPFPDHHAPAEDAAAYAVRHESELEDIFHRRAPPIDIGQLGARPCGVALEPVPSAGVDALTGVGAGVV